MDKIGLGLELDSQTQDPASQEDPKEQRKASVEKCIRFLVHATQCHNSTCKQPSCIKMKRVLTHTRECTLMRSGKWSMCTICKHFVLLCIPHAKTCNQDTCPVPVCARIKKNLRDQHNQLVSETIMFMQQRMAQMHSVANNNSAALSGNSQNTDVSSPATQNANTSPNNSSNASPSKTSPIATGLSVTNPGSNKPYSAPSPATGPMSVGKGRPRTSNPAAHQGKSNLMASTNSLAAMHR